MSAMAGTDAPIAERLAAYRRLFDLTGKTALVLGAASGIGKASAEALAALGAAVICADKNRDGVEATAAAIATRRRAEAHVVDAGSGAEIEALAEMMAAKHARLDIAVTTPAIHVRKLMLDYTDEEYDRVADLNLRGTFLFLRAFGRLMTRQGSGSLIASSSVRATTLEPGLAIYGATKAGIIQMVRGLASEVGRFGVRVNAIVPSIVETPLVDPLKARPRSSRRSPPTRCSTAGASRARSRRASRSSAPTRRATSPAARSWWTAAGPRSTARPPG
jgi:NAD(P)-dependent dehydrogenase (short-subunit alcohol dehydrogenase family)